MADLVERIREALRDNDIESALGAAIRAWTDSRAVALGELVDAIEAIDPLPPFTGHIEDWLRTAHAPHSQRTRGALVRGLANRRMAELLDALAEARFWYDPRLSTQLLALLRALPFTGKTARRFWRELFNVVRTQQDFRFVAQTDELVAGWNVGDDTKSFLANRLREATSGLVEPAFADADRIISLVDELQPTSKRVVTEEQLLASIYEHPDDDGPRLVYADWLQERGDPRGEFIALQLGGADPRRAKSLLAKHRRAWLGPLAAAVMADVEFRRGFLAKCTAKFKNQRDAEQFGNLPAWSTVEEIAYSYSTVRHDQREWACYIGPTMTNVRRAHRPSARFLLAGGPWRIEHLELSRFDCAAQSFRTLVESGCMPCLEHVVVTGGAAGDYLDGVTRCPRHVTFETSIDYEIDRRLACARETPAEMITIRSGGVEYDFTRDDAGAFSRVDIVFRFVNGTAELARNAELTVRARIGHLISHLEAHVVKDGKMVLVPSVG